MKVARTFQLDLLGRDEQDLVEPLAPIADDALAKNDEELIERTRSLVACAVLGFQR